jgi:formylmethanofuran dehydrogenase subunit D
MKKLIFILALIGSSAMAQQTATLTDSDSSIWVSAKWSATLLSPNGPPTISGIPLTQAQQFAQGITNGSGALSTTLTPNNTIDQANTSWQFTIQPNASFTPSIISVTVTSTSQNLTTVLDAGLIAPRFPASATAFGYADIEITSAQLGSQYYNTTTPTLRQFSLAGWTSVAGDGGGGVASVNATGNAVVSATVTNPTTTPVVVLTLTSAPANTVLSNSTGSTAAPTYTTTPAFTGSSITGLNFTQLGGAATIAQLPATTVNAAGTVSANNVLKWVTSNTATNSSLADSGTAITTSEPITASAFNGSAIGLTSFPTGQFAAPGIVSAVTSGLLAEYHFQDGVGASTLIDSSGNNNVAAVTGTIGLTGTLLGGMNACPTGCTPNVAPSGYAGLPTALNTALTMQLYTCTNIAGAQALTGGFFDMPIGGLLSATAPSGGTTEAFGVMLLGAQGNLLTTDATAIAKYSVAPTAFNNTVATTQSIEGVGGCHLITWTRKASTAMDDISIDGHLSSAYAYINTTGTAALVPITSFALGTAPYTTLSGTYKHPYPIYFFNAYSRVLTAAEIQANYGAIQKFMDYRGVPNTIIPATTYSDPGNQIIAAIDSLTYGFNSESLKGWPFYTTTNPKAGTVTVTNPYPQATTNNIATVGYQLEQAIAECPTRGYTAINPNSATTVILWGGTNDTNNQNGTLAVGLASVTPATAYQRLRRLVQCWKSATPVPRVFVMTMISRGISGVAGNGLGVNAGVPMETLKAQFNDLVRKDYAGADGMIDLASAVPLGANGASLIIPTGGTTPCAGTTATTYFAGDSVHLLDCGQQTVASYVSAYLNYADSKFNASNPLLEAANYTETSADVAVNANPATASLTITLPTAVAMVGTDRYIYNIQASGGNTVTVAAASGEVINGTLTSVTCANATKCTFRSVLGTSQGVASPDSTSGAHWEIF